MGKLFDLDSPFMNVMNKLSDLIIINVIYIICCIPVFTIGAATTALYYTTLKIVEDRGSSVVKSFFHSFVQNFKQGTIIWLILVLLGAVLGIDFYIMGQTGSDSYATIKALLLVPVIAILFTTAYVFPLLSRFDNTVKRTITNAFLLSICNLPKTVAAVVLNILPIGILYVSLRLLPVTFLIGFSGVAYLNCLMFLKVFERIMPKEENENSEEVAEQVIEQSAVEEPVEQK